MAVEGGWRGILVGWVIGKTGEEPSNRMASPIRNSDGVKIERLDKMDFAKELDTITTKEEDLDSDDDDLPAFDMSNDTPVTEETKVTLKTLSSKLLKKLQHLFSSGSNPLHQRRHSPPL